LGSFVRDSTCTAPWCHQPVQDAYLCQPCTDGARDHLRDLAGDPGQPADRPRDRGLLADLEITMTRCDVADPDSARPAEIEADDAPRGPQDQPIGAHPLPVHLGAGKVLGQAHRDLRNWVRALVEQRHGADLHADFRSIAADRAYQAAAMTAPSRIPGVHLNGHPACGPWRPRLVQLPDARRPQELAWWLGRHLGDLRQHAAAGEIVAGLDRHRRAAERVVSQDVLEYLGACDHCRARTDGTSALVDLYVEKGAPQVSCPRCGASWEVRERREWLLERARDERVSAPDVVRALVDYVRDVRRDHGLPDREFTADVVKGWGRRDRVTRYEPTRAERDTGKVTATRYKIGDVMRAVVEVAQEERDRIEGRRGARERLAG
jgi:hypothetical protein